MDIEEIDEKNIHKKNNKAKEQHFEEFLEDVENDPEMRQKMNLYKVWAFFLKKNEFSRKFFLKLQKIGRKQYKREEKPQGKADKRK